MADRLHFVEEFSGDQNWSSGCRLLGYIGIAIDKRYSAMADFLLPSGFLMLLAAVWRVTPGGWVHLAPPCSNFIVTSMGSTGRRPGDQEWKGDTTRESVCTNNTLVSRICHILWVCNKRRVKWSIEQPQSSVMFQHRRLAKMIKKSGAKTAEFDMGYFGARTPKGNIWVGTAEWLGSADGKRLTTEQKAAMKEAGPDIEVTKRLKTSTSGKAKFTGGKDMKGSQSYPAGVGVNFGAAMAESLPLEFPEQSEAFEFSESEQSSGNASDIDCLDDMREG